ncbi:Sulfatase-modifying factor enzyme 1 [Thermoflexibacter ruber]|uniref:Sulfatase-modifying factor enzyme 1 n=1 Tax=Thermoflexibacter ruber TaxID=1003 RepID=A0A1I2FEP6_9BACT|nr:Sulfatase-modifying factor enzyme 1 [Thermoflexibacter ruber]
MLIPNLAIRALLIKYKDRFQDFKAKKYWYEIVGYLYSLCNEDEQKHYVFADYQVFKEWVSGSDDSQTVVITKSLYTKQFALEYAFEKLFFQKDKKTIRTLTTDRVADRWQGLGEMLAFAQTNNAYCKEVFTQLTEIDLNGLNVSEIAFLKTIIEIRTLKALYLHDTPVSQSPELSKIFEGKDYTFNCLGILRPLLLAVKVEGGTFEMGQDEINEFIGRDGVEWYCTDEQPVHEVSVDSFSIGKYPVTVGDFRAFIQATGYQTDAEKGTPIRIFRDGMWTDEYIETKGSYISVLVENQWISRIGENTNWECDVFGKKQTDDWHPVIHISWHDAQAYCQWLS